MSMMSNSRNSYYVFYLAVVASLGGCLFGYDTAVISGTLSFVRSQFGLDASMDFFYDGGEKVRPEKHVVKENLTGILLTLEQFQEHDFVLLQEVDKNSKRITI